MRCYYDALILKYRARILREEFANRKYKQQVLCFIYANHGSVKINGDLQLNKRGENSIQR